MTQGQNDANWPPAGSLTPGQRFNPHRLFYGAWIPNWLLSRTEVSFGAKCCYGRMCQHAGEGGKCNPRQEVLAAEMGTTARSIRDYLRELEQHGLIETEQLGLKRANQYHFLVHEWFCATDFRPEVSSVLDRQDSSGQERQDSSAPLIEEENHQKKDDTHIGHNTGSSGQGGGRKGRRQEILPCPTLDEVIKAGSSMGKDEDECRDFFAFYEGQAQYGLNGEKHWITSKGSVIKDWRVSLQLWTKIEFTGNARAGGQPLWANIRILKEQLAQSVANKQSDYYRPGLRESEPERWAKEQEQYRDLRNQIQHLENQQAAAANPRDHRAQKRASEFPEPGLKSKLV